MFLQVGVEAGGPVVASVDPDAARRVLGLPEGVEPVALTPLGHPADNPRPKNRKSLKDLVRYERWE